MKKENLISAGKIVGVHGIRGGIKILSFLETPENFGKYKKFYIDGKEVKLALNFVKATVAVVHIDGIRKRELAEELIGKEVFMDKTELPETDGSEFYYSDLMGLKIMDNGKEVGVISSIEDFGAGELIEINFNDERKTKLFPFNKKIFTEINVKEGFVKVNLPEEEFDN